MCSIRSSLSPGLFLGILAITLLGSVLKSVNCNGGNRIENIRHTSHQHQASVLTLCDASGESTEECLGLDQRGLPPNKLPKFYLYKETNTTGQEVGILLTKNADRIRNVIRPYEGAVWKILIHGFLNNANSTFPVNVRDAYLERIGKTKIKYNILVVDWGDLACASISSVKGYLYNYAAENTANVGRVLGDMLVFLHTNGFMDVAKDAHLIGFSLGAHVAGQAGHRVYDVLGLTVRRITGLEPAGPAFWAWKFLPDFIIPRRRLHRKDTQFLDVYHTSNFFGSHEKMGDIDFWINGGGSQPSCVPGILSYLHMSDVTQVCSHNYVTTLFARTINDNSMHGCQCPSYRSYSWGTCSCSERTVFGEFVDNSTKTVGEFYINTPIDSAAIGSFMKSWHNFSIKSLIQQLGEMICDDWTSISVSES